MDDFIFIAAQWADSTRSDMRDPHVWNPVERRSDRPSRPDDQFAIEFPMKGDFAISLLATEHVYTADVWHWQAGRGNPVGWVDDKYHVISQIPVANAGDYYVVWANALEVNVVLYKVEGGKRISLDPRAPPQRHTA